MKEYLYQARKNLIGPRIKEARLRRYPRVSQEELASRLKSLNVNLDRMAISHLEAGKRLITDFEAVAIAQTLNITIKWLFDEDLNKF